jgi:disulfide bond formation protein DsbB
MDTSAKDGRMNLALNDLIRTRPIMLAALMVAFGGAVTILGALYFQYVLGLKPCPLCLEQRYAYYITIALAALIFMGLSGGASRKVLLAAMAVMAGAFLWNAGLGVYHAGVEWHWWAGPQDCSGQLDNLGSGGNLMKQLESINVVRCDEAAWRFLGLSLAGYNVLISLALAGIALWGFLAGRRGSEGRVD